MKQNIRAFFTRSYEGNIPKMYAFMAVYNFMLFLPIWVLFLQHDRGLSLSQVTLTDVAFWLTMALMEIPTGAVADTIGRKQSMAIGLVVSIFSMILFVQAPTFPLLMAANSLWATGLTFISGANVSLFYESIKQVGREAEYTKLRGRLSVVLLASIGLSSALGGIIGTYDFALNFYINAGLLGVGLLILLFIEEPPFEPDELTGERISYRRTLAVSLQAIRERPNLRYVLLFSNLLPLGAMIVDNLFFQPYAFSIGFPVAAIGIILAGLRLARIAASANAEKFENRLGEWGLLKLVPWFAGGGVFLLGVLNNRVGIFLVVLAGFAFAAARPTVEKVLLRYTPGSVRATILSIDALIFQAFLVMVEPGLGLLADRRGIPTVFIVLGLGVTTLLLLTLWGWRRVWESVEPAGAEV